jgi:hypothetical protein
LRKKTYFDHPEFVDRANRELVYMLSPLMVKKLIFASKGSLPDRRLMPLPAHSTSADRPVVPCNAGPEGGQVRWVAGDDLLRQIQFIDSLFDLKA